MKAKIKISLIRQRIYLWRKFRGITTKRALAKALRRRLTKMSKVEAYTYFVSPNGKGILQEEALIKRHLRERRMIVTILGEMYTKKAIVMYGEERQATEPLLLDFETLRPLASATPQKMSRVLGHKWVQTTFYRRYK